MTKPVCGAQPRVTNGLGFLFINGCHPDPMLNGEHLLFSTPPTNHAAVSQATARFKFSNAANGGKWLSRDGHYQCLGDADVMGLVTNELLIVTLADDGNFWYGAFVGDYTLMKPDYVPSPHAHDPQTYSTIGLLRNSVNGLETLAIGVIPSVRRFAQINSTLKLNTASASSTLLEASFAIQHGGTYALTTEIDPVSAPPGRQAGIIYLVGAGSPCTNLPQREIAVDHFRVQFP